MTRQRVTVLKEFPDHVSDEPSLSVKLRRHAQAATQLAREEKQLQEEYAQVISSASGPIAADWSERWNNVIERRRAWTQAAQRLNTLQNFNRQVQADYITPTMVMAPGQTPPPPLAPEDRFIQGPRYPIRFSPVAERGGANHTVARNIPVEEGETYLITVGDRPVQPAQLRPDRNGDVWPVTISGELRVETDPVTGEQIVGGRGETFYFGPPDCIGHHTRIQDETIIVARSSNPLPVVNEIPPATREAVLENGWQSPVAGFGAVTNEEARRRIRGIRADSIVVDEVDGELALTEMQALRASRAQRNDQYWESMMQGHPAPEEPETPNSRRAANAINDFTRAQMRRQSRARHVLPPTPITDADLEEPIPEAARLHADNPTPVFHDLGEGVSFVGTPRSQPNVVVECWGGGGSSSLKETVKAAIAPPKPLVRRKRVIVREPDEL